jgi:hypothetical protein
MCSDFVFVNADIIASRTCGMRCSFTEVSGVQREELALMTTHVRFVLLARVGIV